MKLVALDTYLDFEDEVVGSTIYQNQLYIITRRNLFMLENDALFAIGVAVAENNEE